MFTYIIPPIESHASFFVLLLFLLFVNAGCTNDGQLQLVGKRDGSEGRVEICFNGTWGTICDDSWNNRDAEIVCRQLGYNTNGAQALIRASRFGQGTGPIYLDDVGCTGSEQMLTSCPRPNPIGEHNCDHSEDAGVQCFAGGEKLALGYHGLAVS